MHALRTAKRMSAFHPAMTPAPAEGGGGTEADDVYGSDLVLWLYGSNATASQWTDASGQGNHVTQGTGANQPVHNTGGQNGHDYVTFDGSNDYYQLATGFAGMGANVGVTVFLVVKRTGTSDTFLWLENSSDAVAVQMRLDSSAFHGFTVVVNNGGAAQNRGALGNAAVSSTDVVILEGYIVSTPLVRQMVSGGNETSSAACASDVTHAAVDGCIVGNRGALDQAAGGDYYEIIVAKVNDDTKRATMRAALGTKYAITLP